MTKYFDAATLPDPNKTYEFTINVNPVRHGVQDALEYIKRLDVERLRDVTIGELEAEIYALAKSHELDRLQTERYKRAFIKEIDAAVFHIY